MLVAPDGSNSAISIGEDGVFLVDTMSAASAQALLTAIRTLAGPKALRWIVNTSSHADHAGGNAVLAPAGRLIASGNTRGGNAASIYAFQEAMMRLNGSASGKDAVAPEGWATDSFFVSKKKMFFNDEAELLMHVPAASTDGDTIVMFRRSDVSPPATRSPAAISDHRSR
jgi:glyoxylase-like metal-dependent hydrolase (beta-lactamase superfamily II)